jgi:hypothetical protein
MAYIPYTYSLLNATIFPLQLYAQAYALNFFLRSKVKEWAAASGGFFPAQPGSTSQEQVCVGVDLKSEPVYNGNIMAYPSCKDKMRANEGTCIILQTDKT